VWEWCWDGGGPLRRGRAVDPRGPDDGGPSRASRGGSWASWRARLCDPGFRLFLPATLTGFDQGFRLARTLP
jgi:formylglycine-generating enzyme required for sulfatase activity